MLFLIKLENERICWEKKEPDNHNKVMLLWIFFVILLTKSY